MTQSVVAQSLEPGAHDRSARQYFAGQTEILPVSDR
jgi:hypothetical protein